jgi:hypothetical protein
MGSLVGWGMSAVLRVLMVARVLSAKLATSLRFPHEY